MPLAGRLGLELGRAGPWRSDRRRPRAQQPRCTAQPAQQVPPGPQEAELRFAALPRVLRGRDYGALDSKDFPKFVQFFRQASSYIAGHRGRTFVLAIPGEVGLAGGQRGGRQGGARPHSATLGMRSMQAFKQQA